MHVEPSDHYFYRVSCVRVSSSYCTRCDYPPIPHPPSFSSLLCLPLLQVSGAVQIVQHRPARVTTAEDPALVGIEAHIERLEFQVRCWWEYCLRNTEEHCLRSIF